MNYKQHVCSIIAKVLGADSKEVTADREIESFSDWDSLRHLEIVTEIEETLDITMDMDAIMSVKSVGDIERAVQGAISA